MNKSLRSSIAAIRTSTHELFLQIVLVFILPIILLYAGVIPVEKRIIVLGIMVGALVLVLFLEQWNLKMLGIRRDTIKDYLVPYIVFTFAMVLLITLFGENITKKEELAQWWNHNHFLYRFLIVSGLQEIAYRGYLMPALGKITQKPVLLILSNAIIFTFLHILFPNPLVGLPVAFIGGVGFAIMYYRYPNLPLIIISHSIINFCIILYGFFVIPGITY